MTLTQGYVWAYVGAKDSSGITLKSQRFMLAPKVTKKNKELFKTRFKALNPFELKLGLEKKSENFSLC